MSAREIPIVFDCEGSQLVGMVHAPQSVRTRGLLAVVAGGPQYRGGVCRMQVQLARQLAARGVPVMRFDYRGLGDSEGRFAGFTDVGTDIGAAIRAFRSQVPEMQEIVLWGGCDAASASMLNGWRYPEVTGLILGNPWVHSQESGDTVAVQHYSQRLRDRDFWLKLLRLQYNPLPAVATVARRLLARLRGPQSGTPSASAATLVDDPGAPFVPRMRQALQRFRGDLLLVMSGRSLLSKEFDALVEGDPAWQQAMRAPRAVQRHEFPDADQAFSDMRTRSALTEVIARWLGAAPGADPVHHG